MISPLISVMLALPALVASQALPAITASPKLRRQYQDVCDPVSSVFVCDRGTCYWGEDGFVGCCSISSCAPRTICIESAELATATPCDHNTGGCVVCSRAEAPYCVTNTNIAMGHYAMYCDRVRAINAYSYTYSWPGLAEVTTAQDGPRESDSSEPSEGDDKAALPSETRVSESSTSGVTASRTTSDVSSASTASDGDAGSNGEESAGEGNSNSGTWAIVGGVLGGALFVALLLLAIWRWRKTRSQRQRPRSVTTPSTATHPMMFASPHPSQPSPTGPHGFAPYAPSSITGYSPPPYAFDGGGVVAPSLSNQLSPYAHELPAEQPPSRHGFDGNQHFWRGAG